MRKLLKVLSLVCVGAMLVTGAFTSGFDANREIAWFRGRMVRGREERSSSCLA